MVESAVLEHSLAQGLELLALLDKVAAAAGELLFDLLVDAIDDGHGLLGGADHTVVERLGVNDGVDSQLDVGSVIDDDGGVACADAQCGLTGAIGGLDHARATGGQDDIDVSHDLAGQIDGRYVDPADDLLGSTGLDGGVEHELGCGDSALGSSGVRGDDDCVARLQANQSLENRSRSGVGGRDDGTDDADGLSDLGDAISLVALEHATGLGVLVSVINILGGVVVLDDLVLKNATAGLLNGHLGQGDTGLIRSEGCLVEDLIDLLLGIGGEDLLRFTHARELCLEGVDVVHDLGRGVSRWLFCHAKLLLLVGLCLRAEIL